VSQVDSVVAPGAPPPSPPSPLPDLACVGRLHRDLRRRPHLRPCAEVNALFDELVRAVVGVPPGAPDALSSHRRGDLQRLCAAGEHELERAWSARIASSDDPARALARFPYLGNYRRLVRREADLLGRTAGRHVRRVAFLGSGPLPLSPLLLASALGAEVDAVDSDPRALDAGRRVAASLGAPGVAFVAGDAATLDVSGYDVVVLAALVGATPAAKRAVLAHLADTMAPGAVLLARSARAARTLLYPPVVADDLRGFDLQAVVHPVDDVVNSVIVARAASPHTPGGR
jgi:SAM-dependent methyltransferase